MNLSHLGSMKNLIFGETETRYYYTYKGVDISLDEYIYEMGYVCFWSSSF